MGENDVTLAAIAVLVAAMLAVATACTSGDVPASTTAATSTTIARRPAGSELANTLGCTSTSSGGVNLVGSDEPATDCSIDDRFVVRFEVVRPSRQEGALARLDMRVDAGLPACSARSESLGPWIVRGPTWIALTNSEGDAKLVIDRLGGTLAPGSGDTGPVVSYMLPC